MNTRRFWRCAWLAAAGFGLASPLLADSITFDLIPSIGAVSGPPGSTVGWGYSITNNSLLDWFLATNLNSDSFSDGTPNLIFDFPEVAPGTTVTEDFDPVNSIGLYELMWDLSAPVGFVNSGNFTLSGQWYDGDPFNGGNYIADAPDTLLPYSATVTSTAAPEPSSLVLLAFAITFIATLLGRPSASRSKLRRS
jgi:hypothetical protein